MRQTIFFLILQLCTKIIEHFRIRPTRVADRRRFTTSAPTPPVFVVVIEENPLPRPNSSLVAILRRANFGNFCLNSSLTKHFLPNFRRFGVSRNTVFFISDKTSDINSLRVQPNHLGQKLKESPNLLFLKIIPKRPVAQHLEHGRVPRVAHIFDILQSHRRLRIAQPRPLRMRLPQKIRQQRLHPRPRKQRRRVALQH